MQNVSGCEILRFFSSLKASYSLASDSLHIMFLFLLVSSGCLLLGLDVLLSILLRIGWSSKIDDTRPPEMVQMVVTGLTSAIW